MVFACVCALVNHYSKLVGAYCYKQAVMMMRQLKLLMGAMELPFGRMALNIVALNQGDLVKDIALLRYQ